MFNLPVILGIVAVMVVLVAWFQPSPVVREAMPRAWERSRPAREGPSLLVFKQAFLI